MNESSENRWVYLSADEGMVIDYLRLNGSDEQGVLASYRISNIIPAQTTKRVWAGHEFQTPDFHNRTQKLIDF